MTTQPRRRWLSFSLRTMFAVVTVSACALGYVMWQWRIVQERKAIIAEIQRADPNLPVDVSVVGFEYMENYAGGSMNQNLNYVDGKHEYIRVSKLRRWLGDQSCIRIRIPQAFDASWIARTERAFPEAILHYLASNGDYSARDSLYAPPTERFANRGTIFKTGLIEKRPEGDRKP